MQRDVVVDPVNGLASVTRRAGLMARQAATAPRHLSGLAAAAALYWRDGSDLPDASDALADPEGLCGYLREVDAAPLREAFSRGLAPWASFGVVSLWSPAQRWALPLEACELPTRQRHLLGEGGYRVTIDDDFDGVLEAWSRSATGSAAPRRLLRAYVDLAEGGVAHSYSVRKPDGSLCAFAFGVGTGSVFHLEGRSEVTCPAARSGLFAFAHALSHAGYWIIANGMWHRADSCGGFRPIRRAELVAAARLPGAREVPSGEVDGREAGGWWPAGA